MTIQTIGVPLPNTSRADAGRFFLPGAKEFASELRLGEVIKGKVLRQYDGNRYLVNFGGQERVVDSGIPLQTGDLIHGRVIGLGDRVELQRLYPNDGEAPAADARANTVLDPQARGSNRLDDLLARYNVRLSADDQNALAAAVRRAADGGAMALSGALLAKLGLKQASELLWPVYNALLRKTDGVGLPVAADAAVKIETGNGEAPTLSPAALRRLADAIDKAISDSPEESADQSADSVIDPQAVPVGLPPLKAITDNESNGQRDQQQLAYWLLNAQADGAVAHRLGTLPLLVGGQLVEVEMSFFEQRRDAEQKPDAKHRKLMFSLKTQNLGRVEVVAHLSGAHARVQIATQDPEKTALVSGYAEQLKTALAGSGWAIDEIAYQTQQDDGKSRVVRSVVEHVVSQDSLSRWV
ncbi:MAG: flagellar hook-length control protein FliK [Gammaproteobacteria bacterium]|nr:flagellar hook-length control protein FliK [Gammaproteobacteria bacterium]